MITDVPITAGRRLRTVTGTVAELLARAAELQGDYLRVQVREKARAGLREELQDALPNALEVRIDPEFAAAVNAGSAGASHAGRTPGELFADYLAERQVDDPRVRPAVRAAARRAVPARTVGAVTGCARCC